MRIGIGNRKPVTVANGIKQTAALSILPSPDLGEAQAESEGLWPHRIRAPSTDSTEERLTTSLHCGGSP